MNLGEMLFYSRSMLQDMNVKRINEAHLVRALNEGKNELAKIIRQAREDFFVTTTTGTISSAVSPNPSVISLPADFAELKQLEITSSGRETIEFQYLDRSDPDFHRLLLDTQSLGAGVDCLFYDIIGSTIEIAPPLDISLAYKMYYVSTVPDMVGITDTPALIPVEHHDYVVTWAVAEGLRSAGDNRYELYLEKLKAQEAGVIDCVNARQIKDPEYVRGYLEDDWY